MQNNLKQIRKKAGLNQKDLGDVLGISESAYCNMENGKRRLSDETLVTLSGYLHVSIDSILGSEFAPSPNTPQFVQDKRLMAFLSSMTGKMRPEERNQFYELATCFMKLNGTGKAKLVEDADTMVRSKKYEIFGSNSQFSQKQEIA